MILFAARLLILAASGFALAIGLPPEWVAPLAADTDLALAMVPALSALWLGLWRYAGRKGLPK